jgi:hypothetical protein
VVPPEVQAQTTVATLEFAGVKYKTLAPSGTAYIKHVENAILLKTVNQFPSTHTIVICEEKYSFTPDILKHATRQQRHVKRTASIGHLKSGSQIISAENFSREAILNTIEGKCLISNYLAENVHLLKLKYDLTLIVDNEHITSGCTCAAKSACTCTKFCTPIACTFSSQHGYENQKPLVSIKQRKGEAELAQVDWILSCVENLEMGDAVVSIVTLGDIDAVVLHLYAISLWWPRNANGLFAHSVFVLLQKPKKRMDIYCITGIL